jgi:hypothetical protein
MFYGILIKMFFDDHSPPHFHAEYGEYEFVVTISPIKIIKVDAPKRVKSMVLEWTALHQEELLGKGVMKLLESPAVFRQVQIGNKGRSIIWDEYDIDFCADGLRLKYQNNKPPE